MDYLRMSLCAGRHNIPQAVNGAVFDSIEDPTDLSEMAQECHTKLRYCYKLDLYVTGLSVALITVVNYCVGNAIGLRLWHYNTADGSYYPQLVDTTADRDLASDYGLQILDRPYGQRPWDATFWD